VTAPDAEPTASGRDTDGPGCGTARTPSSVRTAVP